MGNEIGVVLVFPDGDHYPFTSKLDFDCTMGIRATIELKINVLEVYGDFVVMIYQLKGEWETRDPKMIDYRRLVIELIKEFDDITFSYLPQDENQMADAFATLASKEEEKDDHLWYQDILQYVKNRGYPEQATENDKRTLRRLANEYVLDEEILYKRRKDQVLLRCVDAVEAKKNLGRSP
ncbi:uncharacterized protein [Gossypium hirsutum]|uniref:RNase H type-1 domain-containing protein n=1 Tax=Gossypium hirsutum TaxID=3635 RepID=A0A1U8LCD5_GOSHI|nr:uncharacterized protein LOC107926011 [Gossypium hirsutum]